MEQCEHTFEDMSNEIITTNTGIPIYVSYSCKEKCTKCGHIQWKNGVIG